MIVANHGSARTIDGLGRFEYGVHDVADDVGEKLVRIPGFGKGTEEDLKAWQERVEERAKQEAEREAKMAEVAAGDKTWPCPEDGCDKGPEDPYKSEAALKRHTAAKHGGSDE